MTTPPDHFESSKPATPERSPGLDQRLLRRFRALGLPARSTIVVGFSGGVDSLCLASALGRTRAAGKFELHLIHVDHGIRAESAADAERAREMAEILGLQITVKTLAPGLPDRTLGLGLEEAGRRERYLAFGDVCFDLGVDLIALAHHRQDQAESVLLHLVRGAGLSGAAAMSELTEIAVPWWREDNRVALRLWRPLLDEPRSEIEASVEALGIAPIEDETNADQRFFRNWLRHDMLPKLEIRKPGASASLARYASIAAEEDAVLESLSNTALSRALDDDGGLAWTKLDGEPVAVKRRVIRLWIARFLPHLDFSFDRVEALLAFGQVADSEKELQLGEDAIAVWDRGTLISGSRKSVIHRLRASFDGPLAPDGFEPARLQSGTPFEIDGWSIVARGEGPLVLRTTRPGDRLGDAHLPVREWARQHGLHPLPRGRVLVAETPGRLVWIAGPGDATDSAGRIGRSGWRFELTKRKVSG